MPIPGLLIFLAVLMLTAALTVVLITILTARAILRPPRMTDGKAIYYYKRLSPGDLNLLFESLRFPVRDAHTGRTIHLAAWWMPHPGHTDRCAVLLHDFADAKIGAIDRVPHLHSLGYNVLTIDLRAHGESEGRHTTGGFFERDDLDAVLNQLHTDRPASCRSIILHGVGLGAAVAIATAARRDDIEKVLVEYAFEDYREFLSAHAGTIGLPSGPLLRLAIRAAESVSGADFGAVRPVDLISQVNCPIERQDSQDSDVRSQDSA